MTIHETWDNGALDQTFAPLGASRQNIGQQTVKKFCGKRVALSSCVGTVTCPDCLHRLEAQSRFLAELESALS